jgi:hypothetical protein
LNKSTDYTEGKLRLQFWLFQLLCEGVYSIKAQAYSHTVPFAENHQVLQVKMQPTSGRTAQLAIFTGSHSHRGHLLVMTSMGRIFSEQQPIHSNTFPCALCLTSCAYLSNPQRKIAFVLERIFFASF